MGVLVHICGYTGNVIGSNSIKKSVWGLYTLLRMDLAGCGHESGLR